MKPIVLSMECSPSSPRQALVTRWWPLAAACALLAAGTCEAQLYKWVDENGKVQYSDTIPPAANDRARKELRADGTLKRETERAATIEEKRLAAQRVADEAKAREARLEQERKDKALLTTYADLKDFDRVRDRALGNLETEIRNLTEREAILAKIVAGQQATPQEIAKLASPASAPATPTAAPAAAPGTPPAAGAAKASPPAPAKPAAPKSANALLLEAKSELPRVTELLTRKRRDRADLATLYAAERIRLANLIDAENAKLAAATAASAAASKSAAATSPAPVRK